MGGVFGGLSFFTFGICVRQKSLSRGIQAAKVPDLEFRFQAVPAPGAEPEPRERGTPNGAGKMPALLQFRRDLLAEFGGFLDRSLRFGAADGADE